jgi:hypothetical protein
MKRPRRLPIRDLDAGYTLDLFLVAAVTAVLGIRFALGLAGWPRVEMGQLHIAHMLWGGLLMLVAIVILLSYLGRGGDETAAVLGGLGFGTFIDEIGKFLTRDNDYFYRPSVAIIYVIFILTYMAVRSIHRERTATRGEYLANAINQVRKLATGPLTAEERQKALDYLLRSNPRHPAVAPLRELLERIPPARRNAPRRLTRLRVAAVDTYRRMAGSPLFVRLLIAFFLAQLLVKIGHAALWVGLENMAPEQVMALPFFEPELLDARTRSEWGELASSLLSGLFVLVGIVRIVRDRLGAFRMFQRSILVSIFLTQVFMFYRSEGSALLALGFNMLVFLALRFMIERERAAREHVRAAAAARVPLDTPVPERAMLP